MLASEVINQLRRAMKVYGDREVRLVFDSSERDVGGFSLSADLEGLISAYLICDERTVATIDALAPGVD